MQLRKMLIHTEKKYVAAVTATTTTTIIIEKRISLIGERIQWRRHT